MTRHTQLLQKLCLSIWLDAGVLPNLCVKTLGSLEHLTLDMRNGLDKAQCTPLWKDLLTSTKDSGSKLTSVTLHPLRKVIVGVAFVKHIAKCHGSSLRVLELRNIVLSTKVLDVICARFSVLEEMEMMMHGSSMTRFAEAFASSSTLRYLRNITDRTAQSQSTLSNSHVREIASIAPNIRSIECQGRKWEIMRNLENPDDYAILYTARGFRGARRI